MNTEARLKLKLSKALVKIQRLGERFSTTPPNVHKEFSLVSRVSKGSGSESLEDILLSSEGSARIGHWWETDCLQVVVLGLVNNVRTFYSSCPEFHGEDVLWKNFGTSHRKNVKPALRCYECQGVGHFGRKCPTWQRRRGKTKNSPGKNDPTERLKSQGVRLNPGL